MNLDARTAATTGPASTRVRRFIRQRSAIAIALVIASSVAGCSQQALQEFKAKQQKQLAQLDEGALLAKKLATPQTLQHCKAQIAGPRVGDLEFVEQWRFSPRAVQYVLMKIYSPAKPLPPDQLVAALINKCSGKNMLGFKVASYCGCFYEVDRRQLRFVRTLSALDFTYRTY